MPESSTITSTSLTKFVPLTGQTISSSQVDSNFDNWRGHVLPTDPNTSASTSNTHDLGALDAQFRVGYINAFGSVQSTSGSYTLVNSDRAVFCSAASATTLTLPTAVSITGKEFYIKKITDTLTTITIDGNGSETIDGASTVLLERINESIKLISDGTNWEILSFDKSMRQTNITISQTGWTTASAVAIPYRTDNEIWRLKFNITGAFTGTSATNLFQLSITGVTFKDLPDAAVFQQAISIVDNLTNSRAAEQWSIGYAQDNSSLITVLFPSSIDFNNNWHLSGDVELNGKPTI